MGFCDESAGFVGECQHVVLVGTVDSGLGYLVMLLVRGWCLFAQASNDLRW